jgi:A/G-specific adenine glycosylase
MTETFTAAVTSWYDEHARDLPWRRDGVTPWGVMVSEVMLQQTPVARVTPVWAQWLTRWPTPAALAADSAGEAVRLWGRLGYPRRALRLHAAAVAIESSHDGEVPSAYDDLLALPGIGSYTAAAIASFGFRQRHAVLDTNVRRVYARVIDGTADARTASPTVAERADALARVPADRPHRFNVAVMELGAVVCLARSPRCGDCPVAGRCAWQAAGRPAGTTARRPQPFAGTDRQVRGRLMAVLREAAGTVSQPDLDAVWDSAEQRDRALAGLVVDGLVVRHGEGRYGLPT